MQSTKTLFLLALLATALVYTVMAFDLPWTTADGRIGPGFFPRIVGILSALTLVWAVIDSVRRPDEDSDAEETHVAPTLAVTALIMGFVPTLLVFGALIGMIIYSLVSLFLFNRGRTVQNLLVGVGFPIALYLMFDTWLNATLPRAALTFIPWP